MSRFYKVKLSGTVAGDPVEIWLTRDGMETGTRCKTTVNNLALLLQSETFTTTTGDDGKGFNESPLTDGGGRPFDLVISSLPTAKWNDIKALVAAMITDKSECNVTGTGEPGDFDVNAILRSDPAGTLTSESFSLNWINGVVLRLQTNAIN